MRSAEVAQSFYEAVEGGDLPVRPAMLAADCAWMEMEGFPTRVAATLGASASEVLSGA